VRNRSKRFIELILYFYSCTVIRKQETDGYSALYTKVGKSDMIVLVG